MIPKRTCLLSALAHTFTPGASVIHRDRRCDSLCLVAYRTRHVKNSSVFYTVFVVARAAHL